MSEIKKPSLKGASNLGYGYLGHFSKDKYIEMGHNDMPDGSYALSAREAERAQARKEVDEANEDDAAMAKATDSPKVNRQKAQDKMAAEDAAKRENSPGEKALRYKNAPMASEE